MKPGSWTLSSKTDPRWNCNGRAQMLSVWAEPKEVTEAVERLTKELGEPPADLEYYCMKD